MVNSEQSGRRVPLDAVMSSIEHEYVSGRMTAERFVDAYAELTEAYVKAAAEYEDRILRPIEEKLGFEALRTDTKGGRTTAWFAETGKLFATGEAEPCLVVAVVHPQVGMGASHRNPITLSVVRREMLRTISEESRLPESFPTTSIERSREMLHDEDLRQTTEQAVREAIDEFRTLNPQGDIPDETIIKLAGFDFIAEPEPAEQRAVEATVRVFGEIAKTLPSSGRKEVALIIQANLGIEGGIIYGGPNHPQYNEPFIYNLPQNPQS